MPCFDTELTMPPDASAELGVELAGQQLELLHRLDRHARLRAAVAAVEGVVVVRAVHRVVDVADVLAGDVDGVGAERRQPTTVATTPGTMPR